MTWEQVISALVAVGITVLVRLVNRWLPPEQYGIATAPPPSPSSAPPAGYVPPSHQLDIRE